MWGAPKMASESYAYLVEYTIPSLIVYERRMAEALKAVDWTR